MKLLMNHYPSKIFEASSMEEQCAVNASVPGSNPGPRVPKILFREIFNTMPKLILEYNLPEEQDYADTALGAQRMASAIFDAKNKIRNRLKYEEDVTPQEETFLESLRDILNSPAIE